MAKKSKASKRRRKNVSKKNRGKRSTETVAYELLEHKHLLAAITVSNTTDLSNAPDTSSITALMANDGGDGISLREAIAAANNTTGEDTITFDANVFTGGAANVIRLTQGELLITETLTIDGSTGTGTTITGDTNGDDITDPSHITDVAASFGGVAGDASDLLDDNSRVLNFSIATGDLTLQDLTITGGRTTGDRDYGGGIFFNTKGLLTLSSSTIAGNSTTGRYANGGGIGTVPIGTGVAGAVTMTNSSISGNRTAGRSASGGGIFTASGDVTLSNSKVSENSTNRSGGGITTNTGTVTVTSSTVSGNSTTGINANGGGIFTWFGAVTLTNSTVSGNSATGISSQGNSARGGGIYTRNGEVTLTSSTVTGNSAEYTGGGVFINKRALNPNITIENSIIAGNTDNGTASDLLPDPDGELTINHSLIGVADNLSSFTILGNIGNQLGTIENPIDPLLGPLTDNGGPTQTHALLPASPAIDVGVSPLTFDQRGLPRTVDQISLPNGSGTGVDIGAFERQLSLSTFVPIDLTVVFETLSDVDLSSTEIIQENGDVVTVELTASSGAFAAPTSGAGVIATLLNSQVVTLVGTAQNLNAYLDNQSNLQYTAAAGVVGESAASIALTVDSTPVGVVSVNVIESDSLIVSTAIDVIDPFDLETSLREAIVLANSPAKLGANTIAFDGSVFTGGVASLIRLTQGELEITETLTIAGSTGTGITITGDANGDDVTNASNITDVAASFGGGAGDASDLLDDNSRVLNFSSTTGDLTLYGLTITGGHSTDQHTGAGIIFNGFGRLILSNSAVSGNSTTGYGASGAGIRTTIRGSVTLIGSTVSGNSSMHDRARGGGVASAGEVTLTNSTISGNVGGGIGTFSGEVTLTNSTVIGNASERNGGGISTSDGSVTLISSTVDGNSGSSGGGIATSYGAVTLNNSTVSGNSTMGSGGGIGTSAGVVTLTSSTVSGNTAGLSGAGIYVKYTGAVDATVALTNSTVTGNTAGGTGGGVFASDSFTYVAYYGSFGNRAPSVSITNSIIAGNTDNGTASDLLSDPEGTLTISHSLVGVASNIGAITGDVGNQLGTIASPIDPLLAPLANNGGPTKTHALLSGSPAIDAGNNSLALDENGNPLTTDQRGKTRIGSGTVDIGAVESEFVDPFLLGDADLNGVVDFEDIPAFIQLLQSGVFLDEADINRSGVVDFADIPAFIQLLINGGPPQILLGDADLNGVVDFADIPPFIDLLTSGTFLDEADIDRDGDVDFSDIPPFIDVLTSVGSSALTFQSVVAASPVSSVASLVSISEPESIDSVASTVEVPLTTETSDAIAEPAELVEYDSLEPVEASQLSTAASLQPLVAPQFGPSTNYLPIAPVSASAVEDRLPERQPLNSSTPLSLVGGVASSESRAKNRQFLANDSESNRQETGVVDLLDETFATYEDDLDVVFS